MALPKAFAAALLALFLTALATAGHGPVASLLGPAAAGAQTQPAAGGEGQGDAAAAQAQPEAPEASESAAPADPARDMVLGAADAPVTLIEYASFTCPHCAAFHANVFPQLKANYIDTGKVRYVYREVYFDRFGLWAGMLARCGGDERYFGIVEMLYSRQRQWAGSSDDAVVADNLRRLGRIAGLTDEEVNACLSDRDTLQALVTAFQTNAGADGVTSTPTLIIDGTKHSNMSYADLARLLDARLANR
jgi:protein-disulfide isomerase